MRSEVIVSAVVLLLFILPDEKESVHGKCCVAHRLEHEVPLSQRPQRFVF